MDKRCRWALLPLVFSLCGASAAAGDCLEGQPPAAAHWGLPELRATWGERSEVVVAVSLPDTSTHSRQPAVRWVEQREDSTQTLEAWEPPVDEGCSKVWRKSVSLSSAMGKSGESVAVQSSSTVAVSFLVHVDWTDLVATREGALVPARHFAELPLRVAVVKRVGWSSVVEARSEGPLRASLWGVEAEWYPEATLSARIEARIPPGLSLDSAVEADVEGPGFLGARVTAMSTSITTNDFHMFMLTVQLAPHECLFSLGNAVHLTFEVSNSSSGATANSTVDVVLVHSYSFCSFEGKSLAPAAQETFTSLRKPASMFSTGTRVHAVVYHAAMPLRVVSAQLALAGTPQVVYDVVADQHFQFSEYSGSALCSLLPSVACFSFLVPHSVLKPGSDIVGATLSATTESGHSSASMIFIASGEVAETELGFGEEQSASASRVLVAVQKGGDGGMSAGMIAAIVAVATVTVVSCSVLGVCLARPPSRRRSQLPEQEDI
eukprot:m51a1_g204 hypothetical protein (492) ;mRNA; r:670534-672461